MSTPKIMRIAVYPVDLLQGQEAERVLSAAGLLDKADLEIY